MNNNNNNGVAVSPENASTAGAPLNTNDHPHPVDDESPPSAAYRRKKAKVKESVIDHTYRDYSQVQVAPDHEEDSKGKRGGNNPNFPAKLHAILSNPGYHDIIRWMPHGRSWNIVDKYMLTTVILPHHFSHCKFESFNRSVNGWGFKRLLGDGPDKKTYYHECFLRGRPELTKLMQRLCNPGKRLPDKSGEPNFYEISMKFPLPDLPPASDPYQERNAPKAMQSPKAHQPGQTVMFSSPPPPHANGFNMYGYPQPMGYPQMPTSAAGGHAPPQQPQQMYWAGQVSSSPYQPTPYGYYPPYPPQPQMMMSPQAGPGPQGYYVVQQPYPQHPYFSPTAVGAMPTVDAAAAAPTGMAAALQAAYNTGEPKVMMSGAPKPAGMAAALQAAYNTGDPEVMMSGAPRGSYAEEVAAANNIMWPGGMKSSVQEGNNANKYTDTVKNTMWPGGVKSSVQEENNAKEYTDTVQNTMWPGGMKSSVEEENNAKEYTDNVKNTEEPKEMNPAAQKEWNAKESTYIANNSTDLEGMNLPAQEESNAKESMYTAKYTMDLEGRKLPAQKESDAKECTDSAKISEEDKETKPDVKTESNAEEGEKKENNAEDEVEKSAEV